MVCFEWRVINNAIIVVIFCFTTNLKEYSGEGLNIEKVSPDRVFVNVGQPLRLQINLYQPDKWYTQGEWIFFSDRRCEPVTRKYLVSLRRIGRHDAYNREWDPRATAERLADLVMVNTTFKDTGTYMFKLKIPSIHWNNSVTFSVTIEGEGLNIEKVSPDHVFVNVGQPLRLQINLYQPDKWCTEGVWVFSPYRTCNPVDGKDLVGFGRIGRHNAYNNTWDPRATAERVTDLYLFNTTFKDTGIYMFQFMTAALTHWNNSVTFSVTIEEKPRAEVTCPNIVRLREGEQFSCLCTAITLGRLVPNVAWIKKDDMMMMMIGGNGSYSSQKLSFEFSAEHLAGTYVCRANIGTLVDEKTVDVIWMKKAKQKVRKCENVKKSCGKIHLISISAPVGVAGIFLGVIITLAIKWALALKKQRNDVPVYEEPKDVIKTEYQELDIRRRTESEHCYQPLHRLDEKKE